MTSEVDLRRREPSTLDLPAVPHPPSWPGGPLEPQHFQWADRYAEDRLAFMMAMLAPNAWGFSELRVESAALSKGLMRVSRAGGRFASGLPFDIRSTAEPLERALPASFDERADMMAFLGIARASDDSPNVASEPNVPYPVRFGRSARGKPGEPASLVPKFRILFDDEPVAGMDRLPLARLRRRGMVIEFDKGFLPPMMRMLGGTETTARVDALVAELKKRQQALVGSRRGSAVHMDPARYPQLRLLSSVNRALAALTLVTVRGEPERLYGKLTALLGAIEPLAGVSENIPEYVHAEPAPSFRQVLDRLHHVVPTVAPDPFVRMPLQRRDPTTFHVSAPDAGAFRKRLLLVASGADPRVLLAQVPALAKISGPSHFNYIVQSAVSGVRLGAEFDPPAALATAVTDVCFRLDQRGEYWDDIVNTGSLMLFLQQAPAELSFTLYAVGPA